MAYSGNICERKPCVFFDDFLADAAGDYPANWQVENNSEHVNRLGGVEEGTFCIYFPGNKHAPRLPPLRNFKLAFLCTGDLFFSPLTLFVFFRYDFFARTGFCVKYTWGVYGGRTHYAQVETCEYSATLYSYNGSLSEGRFTELAANKIRGFICDLSLPQEFELKVHEQAVILRHAGKVVLDCRHPGLATGDVRELHAGSQAAQSAPWPMAGAIAFDRGTFNGRMALHAVRVFSDDVLPERRTVIPERVVEFPAQVHGMISPWRYHVAVEKWGDMTILKLKLTGGPSATPRYPEIDRMRFGEKLYDPYVRIEYANGRPFGKFYIFRGALGLAAAHWNVACSVMLLADGQCPVAREVRIDALPQDARFFIGYERYIAEDSITLAGGPAEAVLDAFGHVVHVGEPLEPGVSVLELTPAGGRRIAKQIPDDIPMYAAAKTFAERNFFYYESETAAMNVRVLCRKGGGINAIATQWTAQVTLENVFKEPLAAPQPVSLKIAPAPPDLAALDVTVLCAPITFSGLRNGVYHVYVELFADGLKLHELRRTFEVMSDDPAAPCPPLAAGLPRLYPDILSGIENNHFHPWSPAVVDVAHYNSAGNNYFKVAGEWRVWDLLRIYRREWVCWLWDRFFKDGGIDANRDLIAHADACVNTTYRLDLWARDNYRNPVVFNALVEFAKRPNFTPAPGGALTAAALDKTTTAQGISREQFKELVEFHWKQWILYFTEVIMERLLPELYQRIKAINPDCAPHEFCPVYPTYGSVYKAGYFPFYFGKDLRAGLERWLPGPNGFEDYPYSSGYPIARGTYQLASCKLEAPSLKLYPEVFGINGETRDPRVVYAHPPYGRSNPPSGFFTKQFYEYAFAAVWFDQNGFNFWRDHGFYTKTWSRENYDEMLAAYAFISRVKPAKPLRTGAFAFSRVACHAHPDYFEWDEEAFRGGHMLNTAEEAVAFAYEQARAGGLQAGFVVRLEDVGRLDPADVGLLVLPPLCGVSRAELCAIQKLHEAGVNLIGFEDCSGLEDIFGVAPRAAAVPVTEIRLAPDGAKIFPELADMKETTAHPLCRCTYTEAGAAILLLGNDAVPVLTMRRTSCGLAASGLFRRQWCAGRRAACPAMAKRVLALW